MCSDNAVVFRRRALMQESAGLAVGGQSVSEDEVVWDQSWSNYVDGRNSQNRRACLAAGSCDDDSMCQMAV